MRKLIHWCTQGYGYSSSLEILYVDFRGIEDNASIKLGLWKVCDSSACTDLEDSCNLHGSSCSKMVTARLFITLACIVSPLAALGMISMAIRNQFGKPYVLMWIVLSWLSVVFGLLGMAVGINFATGGANYQLGTASIITIVGFILNVLGAIVGSTIQPREIL